MRWWWCTPNPGKGQLTVPGALGVGVGGDCCTDWLQEGYHIWKDSCRCPHNQGLKLAITHCQSPTGLHLLHRRHVRVKLERDRTSAPCSSLAVAPTSVTFLEVQFCLWSYYFGREVELQGFPLSPLSIHPSTWQISIVCQPCARPSVGARNATADKTDKK